MEGVKTKLSVLWLLHNSAGLFVGIVGLLEPGVLQGIMDGEIAGLQITPEILIIVSIEFLVPFFMAILSLTLKNSINRWANIIVGIVLTGLALISAIEYLANPSAYSVYAVLVWLSIVVVTALIVWYAWKWPKQKE